MVETERLENIKVLKIVMDTRDKVERMWKGKSIGKEIWGKNGEVRHLWDTDKVYYMLTRMCMVVSTGLD